MSDKQQRMASYFYPFPAQMPPMPYYFARPFIPPMNTQPSSYNMNYQMPYVPMPYDYFAQTLKKAPELQSTTNDQKERENPLQLPTSEKIGENSINISKQRNRGHPKKNQKKAVQEIIILSDDQGEAKPVENKKEVPKPKNNGKTFHKADKESTKPITLIDCQKPNISVKTNAPKQKQIDKLPKEKKIQKRPKYIKELNLKNELDNKLISSPVETNSERYPHHALRQSKSILKLFKGRVNQRKIMLGSYYQAQIPTFLIGSANNEDWREKRREKLLNRSVMQFQIAKC